MYELNERLTLKKAHPCGGVEWLVTRVGADIKLQCVVCGKYVNLTRDELNKRIKSRNGKEESGRENAKVFEK